jgi:hypothetical protein
MQYLRRYSVLQSNAFSIANRMDFSQELQTADAICIAMGSGSRSFLQNCEAYSRFRSAVGQIVGESPLISSFDHGLRDCNNKTLLLFTKTGKFSSGRIILNDSTAAKNWTAHFVVRPTQVSTQVGYKK